MRIIGYAAGKHNQICRKINKPKKDYSTIDNKPKTDYNNIVKRKQKGGFLMENKEREEETLDKKEIKDVIEWCDEKGHTEHEILELIRRIVDAKPREEKAKQKTIQPKNQSEGEQSPLQFKV